MQDSNGNGTNGNNGRDLKQKFASLSGAVVVKTEKTDRPVSAHQQLLEDPEPEVAEEKKTFISEKSRLTKKIPFHRDKRVKLLSLIVIGIALSTAAGALTMGKFGMPRWSRESKAKPVARRDGGGTWQRDRFANAMQPLEQPSPPTFKETNKPKSKPAPKGKTARATKMAAVSTSTTVLRRPALRSAYVPPDNPPYGRRPYPSQYTPFRTRPTFAPSPTIKPAAKPVQAESKEQELSPEERRKAAIAATTALSQKGGETQVASNIPAQPTDHPTQPANTAIQTAAGGNGVGPGYQQADYLQAEAAVVDGIPQTLVSRGKQAAGRLMTGFAFLPGDVQNLTGQAVDIEITDAMSSGLPAGARIVAQIKLPQSGGQLKSAPFRLIPVAIAIGDSEFPLPENTIRVSGKKGKPLVAKRQGSEFLRTLGGLVQTVLGGSLGGNNSLISTIAPQVLQGMDTRGKSEATEVLAIRENAEIQIDLVAPLSLPQELLGLSQPETVVSQQEAVMSQQVQPQPEPQPAVYESSVFPLEEPQQIAAQQAEVVLDESPDVVAEPITDAAIEQAIRSSEVQIEPDILAVDGK
jgi:hypothetical protein